MCYQLKNQLGNTEAVIDDSCGISKFYAIADVLSKALKVNFLNQVDDADSLNWDFSYKKQIRSSIPLCSNIRIDIGSELELRQVPCFRKILLRIRIESPIHTNRNIL